ncbi:MAG: alpha/beta hydrolase, partial [Candidatus Nitrosopolaris sp.]
MLLQNIIVSVLSRSRTYTSSERFTERKLFYLERGHGQPVILIHGTLNDLRVWQFQIESFAQKFHVVSYSRRYAYPNQWPGDGEDNNLTNNATDLAELIIKRLDIGPAHLIGHSYGALTALYMAYQHPQLVRTLVLGEPPVMSLLENNHNYSKDLYSIRENVQDAIRRGDMERAVRIFLDGVMRKEGFFYQLPYPARAVLMDNVKSLGGELASVSQRFTIEDAQKVTMPTLLVKGELSPKFLHQIIDILASSMPNSEELIIPAESHNLGI